MKGRDSTPVELCLALAQRGHHVAFTIVAFAVILLG